MHLALLTALAAALAGCGGEAQPPAGSDGAGREPPSAGTPRVFVSILPQADFVERLAGGRVRVEVLVRPGQTPETYSPTPRQMARLAEARVFFTAGVPFEEALIPRIRASMKNLTVVDTLEGLRLREMEGEHEHAAGDHHHGDKDPHVWLDPLLVRRQAETIRDALIALDPAGAGEYRANCAKLQEDLETLHAELTAALAPLRGREILVFHPAYGYFCAAYGLKQTAVEVEGKAPGARQLAAIIERARAGGVKAIFVQPQFSQKTAATVASGIGASLVTMDPLARDYFANMRQMARRVGEALK
jgi:zinc transport system substrate-binding protein